MKRKLLISIIILISLPSNAEKPYTSIELFEKKEKIRNEFKKIKTDLSMEEYFLLINDSKNIKSKREELTNYCFKIRKNNGISFKNCISGKLTENSYYLINLTL